MTEASKDGSKLLKKLEASIDEYAGVFKKLRGASSLEAYLSAPGDRADEEILTEPILRSLIERLLGFPRGAYLALSLRRGRQEIGRITGEPSRLDLLELVLGGAADDGLNETLLPKDLPLFALRAEER